MNLKWVRDHAPGASDNWSYTLRDYSISRDESTLCGSLLKVWVWDRAPQTLAGKLVIPHREVWKFHMYIRHARIASQYEIGAPDRYTLEEAKRACEVIYILGHDLRKDE